MRRQRGKRQTTEREMPQFAGELGLFRRATCRDSGSKTVARVASAFCEQPWEGMSWVSCRVSGTGSRSCSSFVALGQVPLTRHNFTRSQTRVARKKRSQPWLPSLFRDRGTTVRRSAGTRELPFTSGKNRERLIRCQKQRVKTDHARRADNRERAKGADNARSAATRCRRPPRLRRPSRSFRRSR
jgi:hypothetical protein